MTRATDYTNAAQQRILQLQLALLHRDGEAVAPALQGRPHRFDGGMHVSLDGDDTIVSRETTHLVPRDNVTFELGLFMGKLDLDRTILVEPRNAQIKLASDLRGITTLTYRSGADDTLESRIQPVAHEISKHVRRVGVRRS